MEDPDLRMSMYFFAMVLIWLLPLLFIVSSRKTSGNEKLAWVLAMFFISWFAWIFYILIAPIKKRD